MSEIINVYCDESCHLEHDQSNVMVLGAVWCLKKNIAQHAHRLKEIRTRHNINSLFEIKWIKVSKSKVNFYLDVLDYFFDNSCLHFRALVVTRTDPSTGERIPDFRRAERLKWCLPVIKNYNTPEVTFWKYDHGNKSIRTYLWLKEHDYVVVMEEREKRGHAFLNTAFHVDGPSVRRSLEKKFEKKLKS
jgi:Protein of unknown function (DUF3800)